MTPPLSPQVYRAELDPIGNDEAEMADAIARTMLDIADKTFADGRHAIRSVHAKSHGLLKVELEVLEGLPTVLAQGIFREPRRYDAIMRFSTIPGDILDDAVSTPRGLAIKVLGVEGERLEGSDGATQDFVTVNGPQFNVPSAKAFHRSLKVIALTTDRAEGAKKALSGALRGAEKLIEAFGGESAMLKALGGEPPHHILGETFWAQLPLRYGDHIAKLKILPVAPELPALTDKPVTLGEDPDVLRTAIVDHFRAHGGEWEIRAQLCTNLKDMPIDDPTSVWSEDESPFIPVARLRAAPQCAWSLARSAAVDDGMGFSPWHGLETHRPLGEIMRLRKVAYQRSQRFRSERNPLPVREPVTLDDFPD